MRRPSRSIAAVGTHDSKGYGSFIMIEEDGSHQFGETVIISSQTDSHDGTIYVEKSLMDGRCSVVLGE
jgi:hypothetical protein